MRKRIFLYIHQCALRGGVEKVFCNLLNNLSIEDYEITVLSYVAYLKDDLDAQLYPPNVKRHWLYYDEFSTNRIKRLLQRLHNYIYPRFCKLWLFFQKYDTAIAAQEGMYAEYVSKYVHADKKILWIHNDISICHWTKRFFGDNTREATCYRAYDRVICVSEDVKKSMINTFGAMDNLVVCYNPIDTNEIDHKKNAFQVMRPDCPLLVAVGRLAEQKGFDRLLRVCKKLCDNGFDFCVWILGEGEKRQELESYIFKNTLTQVTLLGNQSNPYPYICAADWIICSSRHEGFNTVLQEAVWCEIPIITTETAGTHELLGNNEFGIITENNEDALYLALKSVLSDPKTHEHFQKTVMKRKAFIALEPRIAAIKKLL